MISESDESRERAFEIALPAVRLPGGSTTISASARDLAKALARRRTHFQHYGEVVSICRNAFDEMVVIPVKPAGLASAFDDSARLIRTRRVKDELVDEPTILTEGAAKLILYASDFIQRLPELKTVSQCPVGFDRGGKLVIVVGYDAASGTMAYGPAPKRMDVSEAKEALYLLSRDFSFASPADRSRHLASLITPALVQGAILPGRAPIDLCEADQSQTGKGYRCRVTATIYRHVLSTVCNTSGIGGIEASLDRALDSGAAFVCFDNVRGKLDSQKIESLCTEDKYVLRYAYRQEKEIDPRRRILMMTSNSAAITTDLANRSSIVRILKQSPDYRFREYEEGGLLQHVKARQPYYLGAVLTIVGEWVRLGKPRTAESRHDFRDWARSLDWIVQNLLDAAPLLDGHGETQAQLANPDLIWLREVALAVTRCQRLNIPLQAIDILEVAADSGTVDVPGLGNDNLAEKKVRDTVAREIGRRLSRCFAHSDQVRLGPITAIKGETKDEKSRRRVTCTFTSGPCIETQSLRPSIVESPSIPPLFGVAATPPATLVGV
jgi:hypothetical protein